MLKHKKYYLWAMLVIVSATLVVQPTLARQERDLGLSVQVDSQDTIAEERSRDSDDATQKRSNRGSRA